MTRTLDWVPQDALANEQAERQQAVLTLLHQFNGIEPLKQLFWSELNYDRVNKPLSRRGWKDGVAGLLADDPVLFASGSDAFHIIYARLASDNLRIGDERPVVSKLMQEHPYALSIFSNSTQDQFHFLNVKYDDDVQKRKLYRRITVGPNEHLRTASERIAMLDLAGISPDLFGPSLLAIQHRHDLAFDVEPVTKEFFHEYGRIFEEVEEAITGIGKDKDRKRLYTQRLFNRLMFIAFIQKKGWLKFNGDADYLTAVWEVHRRDNSVSDKNFYRDRLKPLFFHGLNTTNEVNRIGINRGGFLKTLIGDVPYLNGGLFEDDYDDNDDNIKVPDKATGSILKSLFAKFNFTVTESTPLDVEVAVDPEMLGSIFEELVTGRHESGSYYTPKPIVSFMCRESLKGYLETNAAGENKDAIERFVEKHEPDDLRNAESILDALRRVKVCDPACGSGAYLLGMLHELLALRAALFQSSRLDSLSVYQRKLEIIQTNVYGVDIDQFAVNIARLRLWLSLAVDFDGAKPEPLPNLDYKVEVGDSLLGPSPSGGLEMDFRKPLIEDFLVLKSEYLTAHHSHKRVLKEKIDKLKADIASFGDHRESEGFDWAVEFAEVFISKGFDIVLANPPYVRADAQFKNFGPGPREAAISKWKHYRQELVKSDEFETLKEKWDLYIPFLERTFQMLKPSGMMAYIIPDAYNSNKYSEASHDLFLREATIRRIDFCSGVNIFSAGVHNTILFFCKQVGSDSIPLRVLHSAPGVEQFMSECEVLNTHSQSEMGQALFKPQERSKATTFDYIILEQICYISVGMVLNSHENKAPGEFIAEDLVSAKSDARHPKRYVEGKDIERWATTRNSFLEYGTRRSPGKVRRATFPDLYEVPVKLISMDIAAAQPVVTLDRVGLFHNHSAWSFVPWHLLKGVKNRSIKKTAVYKSEVKAATVPEISRDDLENISRSFMAEYLVAVMNSSFAQRWLSAERRNKLHLYPDDWKQLPIPVASKDEQHVISRLVTKLCESIQAGATSTQKTSLEAKIDVAVNEVIKRTSC